MFIVTVEGKEYRSCFTEWATQLLAREISEGGHKQVDVLDSETGEVLYAFKNGELTYKAVW